jgi:hypothetical protein
MASKFETAVKKVIEENELKSLTSMGASRMWKVGHALEAKEIAPEEAVEEFFKEQDYRIKLGSKTREVKTSMMQMIN